ncbi:outer membrane protein transport protein [candidate division KSB1 bacterium]|nr:outer membrane protein transport protein [candidate division KSB1 bacterium]
MTGKAFKWFSFVSLNVLFIVAPLWSTSFYSTKGLGTYHEGIGAAGFGMGGGGIAVFDDRALTLLNPATLQPYQITRFSAHFNYESIDQKNAMGSGHSNYANVQGGHFLIPIGTRYSFSLGIAPIFIADYSFQSTSGAGESAATDILSGKGSLNRIFFSFYVNPLKRLHLGLAWNYTMGRYDERWRLDYDSDYYHDTSDLIRTKMRGNFLTCGLVVQPLNAWNVGAVFSTPFKVLTERTMTFNYKVKVSEIYYEYGHTDLSGGEIDLPASWGIGTAYRFPNKRVQLLADYFAAPFSQLKEKENPRAPNYRDYYRVSAGIAYLPTENPFAPYREFIPLRLGFYYRQLPLKFQNEATIIEYAITAGTALPFYFSLGRMDLGIAWGKRGSLSKNPVEENFFSLMISVTGGEKWFIRSR